MEKVKKYNLAVLITNWIRAGLAVISILGTIASLQYTTGFPVEPVIFGGIAAVAVFNAIWFTVRYKKHAFGGGSLALSIVSLVFTLVIPANGVSSYYNASRLILLIAGGLAVIAGIVKLVFEIKLFKNRRLVKEQPTNQKVVAEKSDKEPTSTVKTRKTKNSKNSNIDDYVEFELDYKNYFYILGAFFIIFEKKCFGWRYIGKSKEGEITRKGKVQVFKYAWFSRAHDLKTSKLFKFVEILSNIFIVISNLFTSFILFFVIAVILLFIFKAPGAAIGIIVSYVSLVAFNVLLALLGKLIFKVQKVRENNPPAFFDYLDSAVDEERKVMEQIKYEKEKQELVEEVKKAAQPKRSESSEAEKLSLLKEYKALLNDGTITKKEFEAKKKQLLK